MKYLPEDPQLTLSEGLTAKLKEYRHTRNFQPELYVQQKVAVLEDYFVKNKIKNIVLGLSGGIDSAVVLKLLENVPSVNIFPVIITAKDWTANQDYAYSLVKMLHPSTLHLDISEAVARMDAVVSAGTGLSSSDWAKGQLVSNLRQTHLHHLATLLNDRGEVSVVCGTTNLDEGGYLGYVGKMSDGLVDLQPISDLHKSEVYALAKHLRVPNPIINREPTGDMFDERSDLDVFGASYEAVELLRWYQNDPDGFLNNLDEVDLRVWDAANRNLQNLHAYNAHKYTISLPSIFFDVMEAHVVGGWNNTPWRNNEQVCE